MNGQRWRELLEDIIAYDSAMDRRHEQQSKAFL
jgi:hypothetical protein